MKKHIIRTLGLSMAIGLTVTLAESAVAQQGRGNANKQATEAREEQDAREKNQNARANAERGNQKGTPKNDREKDRQEREQRDRAQSQKGEPHKTNNDGKGNAYGRDKDGMSGREFGQNRAAEARMTGEQRRAELVTTVDAGDEKVREARERIARAKDELEKNRRGGRMSETELNERRAAIERAETAVRVLEERVNAGRARIAAQQ
jgi:colicin import membrane protein